MTTSNGWMANDVWDGLAVYGVEAHREQIVLQLKAVAHMAKALSVVSDDFATALSNKDMPPFDFTGRRTAYQMAVLGDILNDMDANDEDEDAWLGPVFEGAHRLWPQEPSGDAAELAAARKRIAELEAQRPVIERLKDDAACATAAFEEKLEEVIEGRARGKQIEAVALRIAIAAWARAAQSLADQLELAPLPIASAADGENT
jgi:hypothetical protein